MKKPKPPTIRLIKDDGVTDKFTILMMVIGLSTTIVVVSFIVLFKFGLI